MNRRELLQRITTFPLIAPSLSEDILSGDFGSIFKGQGIEFDEVRRYERGDDVRSIDWNVSARFGTPYVKQYREEKEFTLVLILDVSASMDSGSGFLKRYEQALLAFALIAFSAERKGQPLGALFFDRDISRMFRPRKGRPHIMAIISAALREKYENGGSCLGVALGGAERLLKKRSLVVIVSDFLSAGWEQELGSLCRRNDVIALRISDPLDTQMVNAGLLTFKDPETGMELHAATGFASFRDAWKLWHEERRVAWESVCRRAGAAVLELSTNDDAASVLSAFFRGRKRR